MEWPDVWRALFPRRMIAPDVHEEISFHIEARIEELVLRGWREDRARAFVLERFGDVPSVEDMCRAYDEQRVVGDSRRMMMEAWFRDLRLAFRGLRRKPGFSAIVVLTLALGVGASTAVFSVLEGVVLRPLPYPDPDRLMVVWQNDRATGTVRENASTSDYYDYVERNRTFEGLAIHGTGTAVLTRRDVPPLQLEVANVSRALADVLGVDLQLGRNFSAEEDTPGGPLSVILSDRAWRELFAADAGIIGRSISVDDRPHTVIGVLPASVQYPGPATDVWLPIQQSPANATRPNHWVTVVGRLAEEATVVSAQADMTRIMADLEVEFADNENRGAFVEPLAQVGRGDLGRTLWVLFGAVLAVLAVAFVNAANLLLARGATRLRELAVLKAVGAGSVQIARRFFAEGILITLAASVGGVALAFAGVRLLTALAPADVAVLGSPQVNPQVLAFALGVSLLVCMGVSLLPSLQARRIDMQRELKDGRTAGRGAGGLAVRRLLVAAQLSLAVVLLLGATLLMGTVRNLQSVDPGFRAENTLRMDFALPDSRYPDFSTYPRWPQIYAFMDAVEAGVGSLPAVTSVAIAMNHPLDRGFTNSFRIEGRDYDPSQGEITTRLVTPGYFETAGVDLVEGRLIGSADRVETSPVIVLNRAAAQRYFPGEDAVGQRFQFWGPGYREVVGVVEDERIHGLSAAPPPAMYLSMFQAPPRGGKLTLMLQSDVPPAMLVDPVREVLTSIDPDVPLFNITTMEATLAAAMARERFASTVLAVFASVAVLLALMGVHGVLAYLVAQRGHEVGVRMALGATRGDVVKMIVGQGATMTLLGIAGGIVASVAVSGVLQSLLFGVSATAPGVYAGVGLALGAVALGATAVPALRAASIDPVRSLRSD